IEASHAHDLSTIIQGRIAIAAAQAARYGARSIEPPRRLTQRFGLDENTASAGIGAPPREFSCWYGCGGGRHSAALPAPRRSVNSTRRMIGEMGEARSTTARQNEGLDKCGL